MLLWMTVGLSFALSFLAKWLADAFLHSRVAILGSFAGLQHSLNRGIAFSITFPGRVQTLLIAGALCAVIAVALRTARTPLAHVGYGLLIGGALGNAADRLFDGTVTDFIQVGTFPIFNVADSCITVGVGLLLLEMVLRQRGLRPWRGKGER